MQLVQVIDGELSGITGDDIELMGNLAWDAGCNLVLGGANLGSPRGILLEEDDSGGCGSVSFEKPESG